MGQHKLIPSRKALESYVYANKVYVESAVFGFVLVLFLIYRKISKFSNIKEKLFNLMPKSKIRTIQESGQNGQTTTRQEEVKVAVNIKVRYRSLWGRLLTINGQIKEISVYSRSASFDTNPNVLLDVIKSDFGLQSKPARSSGDSWFHYEILPRGQNEILE